MAREAVIVDCKRTGLTKAHRGSFNITSPVDYVAHCMREVAASAPNLDPEEIEDVVLGCGFPEGVQGMNMGRIAAMAAGLPVSVAATTVNRFCSSGSQGVAIAAHMIVNEGVEAAIGAGVETITMMQDGTQNTTRMVNETARKRFPGLYFPMGLTAEIVAERYKVSREDQDAYALRSQQRTAHFQDKGWMAEEIAPMTVTMKNIVKDGGAWTRCLSAPRVMSIKKAPICISVIDDPDQCLTLFRSNGTVGWLIFLGLLGGGVWAHISPLF